MLPPAVDESGDLAYRFHCLATKEEVIHKNKIFSDELQLPAEIDLIDDVDFVGSSHGWLALYNRKNTDLFLSNPIVDRHVKLPPLPTADRVILSASDAPLASATFGSRPLPTAPLRRRVDSLRRRPHLRQSGVLDQTQAPLLIQLEPSIHLLPINFFSHVRSMDKKMEDVVFVTRLHGSLNGCQYLKAICLNGDHLDGFFLDMSFMGEFDYVDYIEANYCGGIFCFNAFNGRISLCNPFANTVKFLPPTLPAPPSSYISFYNCGFGYDAKSDDYKVIRIFDVVKYNIEDSYSFSGATRKCELFSFKRNSWKEIESEGSSFLCADGGYALVDCSFHWLAMNFILAFNFSEEIFSYISLPPSFNVRSFNGDTPVCQVVVTPNYRLGVIFYSRVGESKTFQVWEYGIDEVWYKLYNDDAIISNVDKPLNLNGSLMYVSRESSPGRRQLLVYDWVGRILKELEIYDCEDVLGISTITTSFPTPKLRKSMPINGQSAEEWNACWDRHLQKVVKKG